MARQSPGSWFARCGALLLVLGGLGATGLATAQKSSTMSLQLDPATCANATTGQSPISPGANPLELRTLWGQPTCKGTLTFTKQASERVFFENGIDASVELAGTAGATSGSVVLELAPSPSPQYLSIALQPYTSTIVALPPLTVVETTDLQAPSSPVAGNPWVASSLNSMDAIDWTNPPANAGVGRCFGGAGENIIYRDAWVPMRWLLNGAFNPLNPSNPIPSNDLGGYLHTLDVQRRVVNGIEQWRVSMHLPDTDGMPTWLQTQWGTVSGGAGERKFRGFLRRHTWNAGARMRNAGVPVGVVVLAPRDHGPANGLIMPGLGMRVNWRIEAAGLRSTPSAGLMGCMLPAGGEVVDAQVGTSAVSSSGENSAHAGVWGGLQSMLTRVEDAMAVHAGGAQLVEDHVLRVWDGAGKPVWLGAAALRTGWTLPTVEGAGSTALKLRAFMSTPSSLSAQRTCWIDLKKIATNQEVYLRRELAVTGGALFDGRLGFDLAGVRALSLGNCASAGVASMNALDWSYPAVPENPGPVNTRLTNLFNPYLSRLEVYPRICRLQGALGESCPVRLSFAWAAGYRIRRNSTVIHPQSGALPMSGVRSDAVAALGQHCYTLINGSNEPVSETSCVFVRQKAEMPPALGCAKFVLASYAPNPPKRCDATDVAVQTVVAPGTMLKMMLQIPDPRVAKVHISQGFFTQPLEVQVNQPTPFVDLQVETGHFAASMTEGYYEFEVRTCDNQYLCSAPITVGLTVGSSLPAPSIPAADSPYPEIVRLAWSHTNPDPTRPVTFKIARWSTADVLQQPEITGVTGATNLPNTFTHAFAVPGGTTWRYGVAACRGTTCSAWAKVDALVAAADLNLQATPTTSPTGVFTLSWKSIPNTLRYEAQTAPGEPVGTWVSPATNVAPSANPTVTHTWPALPANTHRFRVRGCISLPSPIGVVCGLHAQTGAVTSTLGGSVAEIPDDPAGNIPAASRNYQAANHQFLAGALTGNASVVGGSARYSLPIEVPPGRRGMQPAVALEYSSRGGNGPLGIGFSLTANSAISRCPQTRATDGVEVPIVFGPSDRLCLDGQRLVAAAAAYGQNGTKYRTEIESWVEVTQLGGSLGSDAGVYFEARLPNGEVHSFGRGFPGDTAPNAQNLARVRPGGLTGTANTLSWLLDSRTDRSGNHVHYRYGVVGNGEHLLAEIAYTGQAGVAGSRRVDFEYEPRPDLANAYLAGGLTQQTRRLKEIRTRVGADVVSTYKLRYQMALGQQQVLYSNAARRSLLRGIQRCGAGGQCLEETVLDWQDVPVADAINLHGHPIEWPPETNPAQPQDPQNPLQAKVDYTRPVGDVDGDGVTELLRTVSKPDGSITDYLVSFSADRTPRGAIAFDHSEGARFADFNNDGRVDQWWEENGNFHVRFWNAPAGTPWGDSQGQFVAAQPQLLCALSHEISVEAADLNNDGLADLFVNAHAGCGNPAGLYFFINSTQQPTGATPNFAVTFQAPLFLAAPTNGVSSSISPNFNLSGDLDGDGLADVFGAICKTNCGSGGGASPTFDNFVIRLYRQTPTGPLQVKSEAFAAPGWFPADANSGEVPGNARRHSFSDINGDGLLDLILVPRSPLASAPNPPQCKSVWSYRMNTGRGFGALQAFQGQFNTYGVEEDGGAIQPNLCQSVARGWDEQHASMTSFEDLDGDGRTEILVPSGFENYHCTRIDIKIGGFLEGTKACPPHPREPNPGVGFVDKENTVYLSDVQGLPIHVPLASSRPDEIPINENYEILDSSDYAMSRLVPEQTSSGYVLRMHPLQYQVPGETSPQNVTRQIQNGQFNRDGLDFFGDGLQDQFSASGCRLAWPNMDGNACLSPLQETKAIEAMQPVGLAGAVEAVPDATVRFLVNNGAGHVPGMAAQATEMLKSVTDAFGVQAKWTYDTLSSRSNRGTGELPLYAIPGRNEANEGYVDARHFYFASSMNVVAQFEQRDGRNGFTAVRYGYEEAMFNNAGRGFAGFRKVITEQLPVHVGELPTARIRNATIFHQKFPLVSQPECELTQQVSDSLEEIKCSTDKALSLTLHLQYRCIGAPGDDCVAAASHVLPDGAVWRVFNDRVTVTTRDLADRSRLLTVSDTLTSVRTATYDQPETQTRTITDYGDLAAGQQQTLRTHTTTTTNAWSNDPVNWWIGRLNRVAVRSTLAYDAHAGGPGQVPHATVTLFGYHEGSRQADCEARFGSVAIGATCADSAGFETRVRRTFGTYGNLATEKTEARGETAERRKAITEYSADGYFPLVTTDAFDRPSRTEISPKFGLPLSTTDANQLKTTMVLDALGRVTQIVPPEHLGSGMKLGFPIVTAYERCDAVVCPGHAKTRVVTSQFGSPQSMTYVDSLGRNIRTSTKTLHAPFETSGLNDTSATVTEVSYDARGRIWMQYQPYEGGPHPYTYTEYAYDALDRPVTKWDRFSRADEDAVNAAAANYKRTDYLHSGFTTVIQVCQRDQDTRDDVCPATGNNVDGSPRLRMTRRFDSAGKLLETVDAKGESTRYWFDSLGMPVQITDVMDLKITAANDSFGRRVSVTDPSSGTWAFAYNGYGEVVWRRDARHKESTYRFDVLGRPVERTWTDAERNGAGTVAYTETTRFDNLSQNAYGTMEFIERVTAGSANNPAERFKRSFTYDALARPLQTQTRMQVGTDPELLLTTASRYDRNFGRVKQLVYPTSGLDHVPVSLYQLYAAQGMLVREGFSTDYNASAPAQSPALRVLTLVDERGLPKQERLGVDAQGGSDWYSQSFYDRSGWLMARCVARSAVCDPNRPTVYNPSPLDRPVDQRYRYDLYGNLVKQWHNGAWAFQSTQPAGSGMGEMTFEYDALMRLKKHTRQGAVGGRITVDYDYNEIGGLRFKTDYSINDSSAYTYEGTSHRLSQVQLAGGGVASFLYDANGNVVQRTENGARTDIAYDIDNLPRRIGRIGGVDSQFYEGPDGRWLQRLSSGTQVRDTWMLEKAYEREVVGGAITAERYYLAGGSLLTIRPTTGSSTERKLNFLHGDRLGSPVAISEKSLPQNGTLGTAQAQLKELQGFDAFGKALDEQWSTSNNGLLTPLAGAFHQGQRNQRGFTGHEHLDEYALIHMNGRAYDYNLGRFLGVDPFIQFPDNSQSLNPYAYLMNNPLSGTDPTGYKAEKCGPVLPTEKGESCTLTVEQDRPDTGTRIKKKAEYTVTSNGVEGQGSVAGNNFSSNRVVEAIGAQQQRQQLSASIANSPIGLGGGRFALASMLTAAAFAVAGDTDYTEGDVDSSSEVSRTLSEDQAQAVALAALRRNEMNRDLLEKGADAFFEVYPEAKNQDQDPDYAASLAYQHMRAQLIVLGSNSMRQAAYLQGKMIYNTKTALSLLVKGAIVKPGKIDPISKTLSKAGMSFAPPATVAKGLLIFSTSTTAVVGCGGPDLDCGFLVEGD